MLIDNFNFCKDYFILDLNKSLDFELRFPDFLPCSENERLKTTSKGKMYKNPLLQRQRDLIFILMQSQGLHNKIDTFNLKAYSLQISFIFSYKQLLTSNKELRKNDLDNYLKPLQDDIIYFFNEKDIKIDDCQCIDLHTRKWYDDKLNDKETLIKVHMDFFY